jgi:hypothetical protein
MLHRKHLWKTLNPVKKTYLAISNISTRFFGHLKEIKEISGGKNWIWPKEINAKWLF